MPTQTCTPRYVHRRACRDTHVQTHTRTDAHTCSCTQAQISFSVYNTCNHTLHHVALRGTTLHYTAPLCNAHPQRATFRGVLETGHATPGSVVGNLPCRRGSQGGNAFECVNFGGKCLTLWRPIPLVVEANAFECVGRCLWLWSSTYDTNARVRVKSEL